MRSGRAEIEHLIATGLQGTSVTAVLAGTETASRPRVSYEIEKSIEFRRPSVTVVMGCTIEASSFGRWVEFSAPARASRVARNDRKKCFMCRRPWW